MIGFLGATLSDLVLPALCAGCAKRALPLRHGVCQRCADVLRRQAPGPVRPMPAPRGLPGVVALGPYDGVLRAALLAYKERGRHRLAGPLGALLAEVIATAVPAGPMLLVAVPSGARAARQRRGDHMARLARRAVVRLRAAGREVTLLRPLRALPRVDFAGLGRAERAMAARHGFRPRAGWAGADNPSGPLTCGAALGSRFALWPGFALGSRLLPGGPSASAGGARPIAASRAATLATPLVAAPRLVIVDDIVTTGATLAAVAITLARIGLPASAAAVLAATPRRLPAQRQPR